MRRARWIAAAGAAALLPRAVRAAEAIALQVGGMLLDASAQIYYAEELGTFKNAGLDVKLTILNNGSALVAATMSGAVDIGFASASPLIAAHVRGLAVRFVAPAAVWIGPAPNSGLVVLRDSPLRTAADLGGKVVGVAGLHDLTQYEAQLWIDKNGGNSNAVQFVEIPYAEIVPALQQGRISAGLLTEPFLSNARAATTQLGNLSEAVGGHYLLAGWFASDAWLAKNADAAKRFAAVMQQTARWGNAHQRESAPILARYTKIDPQIAATMPRAHYDDGGGVDPRTIQPLLDIMVKYGKLAPFPAADLVWTPPR